MEVWLVIGISGVTNGGKTTLAQTLHSYLSSNVNKIIFKENIVLNKVVVMNQDEYFLPVDSPKHEHIEKLNHKNWEIITSMDMDRMTRDIMNLLGSKFLLYNCNQIHDNDNSIADDTSDFDNLFSDHFLSNYLQKFEESGCGNQRTTNLINLQSTKSETFRNINIKLNVLILEGFLIFNHPFTLDLCNIKFHLHLPYEKCYARRIKRIYDPPDVIGYFEMFVWPFYEKHFQEFKNRNDIFVLNGELSKDNIFNYVLNSIKNIL
uniref:Putative of the uridine kinase family n=1 Tax=Corethrella appendiculata TaxID=1370023 RepID=U5EYX8_9DIPT